MINHLMVVEHCCPVWSLFDFYSSFWSLAVEGHRRRCTKGLWSTGGRWTRNDSMVAWLVVRWWLSLRFFSDQKLVLPKDIEKIEIKKFSLRHVIGLMWRSLMRWILGLIFMHTMSACTLQKLKKAPVSLRVDRFCSRIPVKGSIYKLYPFLRKRRK